MSCGRISINKSMQMIVCSITTCIKKNPEVKVIYEYAIVLPKILKFLGDRLELLSSCIAHLDVIKKTLVVSEYTVGPHRSKLQIVGDNCRLSVKTGIWKQNLRCNHEK